MMSAPPNPRNAGSASIQPGRDEDAKTCRLDPERLAAAGWLEHVPTREPHGSVVQRWTRGIADYIEVTWTHYGTSVQVSTGRRVRQHYVQQPDSASALVLDIAESLE